MSLAMDIVGAIGVAFVVVGLICSVAVCNYTVFGGQTPESLHGLAKASMGMMGIGGAMMLLWGVLGPLRLA